MTGAAEVDRGSYVALLGLDGSGKSTIARGLTERLAARGHRPRFLRWRDIADQGDRADFPYLSLRQLLMEGWRVRYGGATDAASLRVQHGPLVFEDFKRAGLDRGPVSPTDIHSSGVVASAVLEFTAELLIHAEILSGYLSNGETVVTESFGYKNIMKALRVAKDIPRGDVSPDFIARTSEFIADAYSSRFLQPDVGVLLKVAPEECYRRITTRRSGVGALEDLGFAGRAGRSSFIELQGTLLAEYEQMAAGWGWHLVDLTDASAEEALDAVADVVIADLSSARSTADLRS